MKKPLILLFYAVALFFGLRKYYQQGNSGLPNPQVISAPTYLYGIAALAADFVGPVAVVIAAGLTVSLIWQTQKTKGSSNTSSPTTPTTPNNPTGKAIPGPSGTPITGGYNVAGTPIDPVTGKPATQA